MKNIFIHADDFGNSYNISKCIDMCYERGVLNSTSIIVNSIYFEKSLNLIKSKNIRKVLHLNIAEGTPISNCNFLYLTNKKGLFYRSWQRVVIDYYLASKSKKNLIKSEIKEEFKNQILLYMKKLNTNYIHIDSHQHYHVIPFITDILIELKYEIDVNILNIRVTKEPFFFTIESFFDLKNYLGINFLVHFLLNFLANKMINKFKKHNITYNQAFIGVLFSGNMNFKSIVRGLEKVKHSESVEILLHPGFLSNTEKKLFRNDKFKRFYVSKYRKKELRVLLSNEFKKFKSWIVE